LLNEILKGFPAAVLGENCRETSPKTDKYNCIAWAAGDDSRQWDPRTQYYPYTYWPRRAPAGHTVEAIEATFLVHLGYARTDNDRTEHGIEKVAIFADAEGRPMHMARQLRSGTWTSKLGEDEDIEHSSLSVLEGGDYGRVALVLARPLRDD